MTVYILRNPYGGSCQMLVLKDGGKFLWHLHSGRLLDASMIVRKLNFLFLTFLEKLKSAFIYRSFHLITGINPWKLIVTLKGEAKVAQSSRAGIYVLGPDLVNGKSHWLQDPGSNSIWYDDKKGTWNIATQNDLGSDYAYIYSDNDVAGPQVATTWHYYDNKWITSDDILVDTFAKTGTYK